MASTIQIKRGTGSAIPSGLADGELAINLDDGRFYFGSGSTSVNNFRFTNLTADNYIVSSSVTNYVFQTLSGSSDFGDDVGDIHNRTGSLNVSGALNINGTTTFNDGNIINVGNINLDTINDDASGGDTNIALTGTTLNIEVGGETLLETTGTTAKFSVPIETTSHITASGDISASGNLFGNSLKINSKTVADLDADSHLTLGNSITPVDIKQTSLSVGPGTTVGHITASGNISSSGDIIGSRLLADAEIYMGGVRTLYRTGTTNFIGSSDRIFAATGTNIKLNAPVTASGNISASGNIIANTGSLERLELSGGVIDLKNSGAASKILLYCEDNNQHAQTIQGAPHSDGASNTLTLPSTGTKFATQDGSETFTNKTLTSPDINTPNIDGGTIDNTIIGNSTAVAATFTTVTSPILLSTNITASNNISASGTITANAFDFSNSSINVAHVTSSGNISSSGTFISNEITASGNVNIIGTLSIPNMSNVSASIAAAIAGGDNLGNHTATTDLNLDSNNITNVAEITATGNVKLTKRIFTKSTATDNNLGHGDIVYIGGGSTTLGDIVYMKTDGEWGSAQANSVNTATSLLGIALGTDPDVNGVLLRGTYTLDHDVANNQGVPLYLSDGTAGQATATKPDTSGDVVRIIGYNLGDDDEIWFDPDKTWVEIA